MPDISKINLNGTSYNIKDANAVRKQVAATDEIKAYCATDSDTMLVSVAQGEYVADNTPQIMMTDADGVFRRPLYPGGVSGLGNDGLPNVSEVRGMIQNAGYIVKTDNEGVYVNEGIGDNRVINIPLDQQVEAATQIVTKDPDYQIKKPSYSGGIEGLSDTYILNKKETDTLITSKNYATQAYVRAQLNTVTKVIYIVNGLNRTGYYVSNELIGTNDLLYSNDIELNPLIQSDLYSYMDSATSTVNYKFVYIYETPDQTITCYNYFIENRHVVEQFAIYFNYVYTGSAYTDFTAQTAIIAAEQHNNGNAEIQIKEQTFI